MKVDWQTSDSGDFHTEDKMFGFNLPSGSGTYTHITVRHIDQYTHIIPHIDQSVSFSVYFQYKHFFLSVFFIYLKKITKKNLDQEIKDWTGFKLD